MRALTPIVVAASLAVLGAAVWWAFSAPEPVPTVPPTVPPVAPVAGPAPSAPDPVPAASPPAPAPAEAVVAPAPPAAAPLEPPPIERAAPGFNPSRSPTLAAARALLDGQEPHAALQKLDTLEAWTAEAELLRAEAHAQLGDRAALETSLKKLAAEGHVGEAKALKRRLAR